MTALPSIFLGPPLAHRGYHDLAGGVPENSRAAFEAAIAAGYGIELDVQLTADGEAMVFHDYDLGRLTPETGAIRQSFRRVTITDCGLKMGLNGVDNGRLMFDGVRVPRENLLDRCASVGADGRYSSPITSASKRFFVMLGTLVGGRVSVAIAGSHRYQRWSRIASASPKRPPR